MLSSFQRLWTGASDALSLEIRLIRKDGSLTWAKLTVSLLRDREGWPSHLLAHVKTIQELHRAATPLLLSTPRRLMIRQSGRIDTEAPLRQVQMEY